MELGERQVFNRRISDYDYRTECYFNEESKAVTNDQKMIKKASG